MPERPAAGVPTVVHADADLLVLDKPSGMPTTSPDGKHCLAAWARGRDPHAPRMHPSSRLDAEVTGLVTFARTDRAITALLAARRAHRYGRTYLGLCAQPPQPAQGAFRWSIARDPRDPRRRVATAEHTPRASAALTYYTVACVVAQAALLVLEPQTGRTHQLRVHAARAGSPLLGDRHYGGLTRLVLADGRVLRAARVMLHCARLQLPDIAGGAPLVLRSPPPADMCALWQGLGGPAEQLRALMR